MEVIEKGPRLIPKHKIEYKKSDRAVTRRIKSQEQFCGWTTPITLLQQ